MRYPLPRWLDRLETAYYNVYYGVQNLVRWFPVVWRDRDWDEAYLFNVMAWKMSRMSRHQAKYSLHVGADRHARELLVCAELCQRLADDNFADFVEGKLWWKTYHSWPDWRRTRLAWRTEMAMTWTEQYLWKMLAGHMRTWWS